MSFETTCNFLTKAVGKGDFAHFMSPSSRIVLGKLSDVGSGNFDVLVGGSGGRLVFIFSCFAWGGVYYIFRIKC
ncbi:hypothetical protein L873DRAFT_821310, partial [Choiromyces venosus 120613-1]